MEQPNETPPITVLPRLQRAALVAWSVGALATVVKNGRKEGDAFWMASDSPPPDTAKLDLCVEDASAIRYEPEPGRPAKPGEWASLAIWSRADDEGVRILIPCGSEVDASTPLDFAKTACRTYNGLGVNGLCRRKGYRLLHRLAEAAFDMLLSKWNATPQEVQKILDDLEGGRGPDGKAAFGIVAKFLEQRQVGIVRSLADGLVTTYATEREYGFVDSLRYAFHRAQKFIVPDLDDVAESEEAAMNEAVSGLARHGLLHLPYSEVVIADTSDSAVGDFNRYYVVAEHDDGVHVQPILAGVFAPEVPAQGPLGIKYPLVVPPFMVKSLVNDNELFWAVSVTGESESQASDWMWREANTAVFVVTVFLASLAAGQEVVETVPVERHGVPQRGKPRKYGFGIVRIPRTHYAAIARRTSPDRKPVREHEVRGYIWGKNTRPLHEQRWIAPHKKGHGEAALRNHYVVPTPRKRRDDL